MQRVEWELLRKLDRRTEFLTKKIVEIEKDNLYSREVKQQLDVLVLPTIEEVRAILEFRKKVRRVLIWVLSVALGSAITTVVSNGTNIFLHPDSRQEQMARTEDVIQ